MYQVDMVKIDAAQQKESRVPMLPGAIPGAETSLLTLDAGKAYTREPETDKAFIYLTIDGKFRFHAGRVNIAVEGRYVFIPGPDQQAEFQAATRTRLLEICWEIPPDSRGEWKSGACGAFPYVQEYITSTQYRDKNKSDKTISREWCVSALSPASAWDRSNPTDTTRLLSIRTRCWINSSSVSPRTTSMC